MSDDRRPSPPPRPSSPRSSTERHPALRPRADEEEARLFAETARAHDEWQKSQSQKNKSAVGNPQGKPGQKPYVRKKRPRTLGSRLRSFTFWVVLPCAIVGGGGWAMTSPVWNVGAVDIEGAQNLSPALVEPLAGEMMQQNWLRADLSAMRSRFSKLPTVQSASVSREWSHWPPRLRVQVQERSAWLRLGGGATWWAVDRAGVAFRRATPADADLYAITATAFEAQEVRAGQKVPVKVWSGVKRLALALEASEKKGQKWPIRRAYVDRDSMASLRLRGGPHDEMLVRLGDGMWAEKMARAREALAFFEAAGRRASTLNLVSFSMPTWTPLPARPPAKPTQNLSSRTQGSLNASSGDAAASITPPIAADNSEVQSPEVSPSTSPST